MYTVLISSCYFLSIVLSIFCSAIYYSDKQEIDSHAWTLTLDHILSHSCLVSSSSLSGWFSLTAVNSLCAESEPLLNITLAIFYIRDREGEEGREEGGREEERNGGREETEIENKQKNHHNATLNNHSNIQLFVHIYILEGRLMEYRNISWDVSSQLSYKQLWLDSYQVACYLQYNKYSISNQKGNTSKFLIALGQKFCNLDKNLMVTQYFGG